MKSIEMLNQIKTLLGVEEQISLEKLKLDNGTVIEADEFSADKEVFIVTEDERVAMPIGEYQLEDGRTLKVVEEGLISEIVNMQEEEEEVKEEEKEEMQYVTKEEFGQAIDEIKAMITEMGYGNKEEEMSTENNEALEEVKEELSKEPSAKPLTHNPEAKVVKQANRKYATKRPNSTRDIIFNKLFNN